MEMSGDAGHIDGLTERMYLLFTPLLPVSDEAFRFALSLEAPGLGANDRLHVGTCLTHGIEVMVSADSGFDSVPGVRRVDPLDQPAVRQLVLEGP